MALDPEKLPPAVAEALKRGKLAADKAAEEARRAMEEKEAERERQQALQEQLENAYVEEFIQKRLPAIIERHTADGTNKFTYSSDPCKGQCEARYGFKLMWALRGLGFHVQESYFRETTDELGTCPSRSEYTVSW